MRSKPIRQVTLFLAIAVSVMLAVHREHEYMHVHVRYYTVAIVPLLLGLVAALQELTHGQWFTRWGTGTRKLVLCLGCLWLAANFFKIGAVAHDSWKAAVLELPRRVGHWKADWIKEPPRPLNTLELAFNTVSYNVSPYHWYGESLKHRFTVRDVPYVNPKEDPDPKNVAPLLEAARADLKNVIELGSKYDIVTVYSHDLPQELSELYEKAFTQAGWIRAQGRLIYDIRADSDMFFFPKVIE